MAETDEVEEAVEAVTEAPLADEEEAEEVVVLAEEDVAEEAEEVAVEVDMKPTVAEEAPVLLQAQSPTGTTLQKNTVPFLLKTCRNYLKSGTPETPREVSAPRLLPHRHLRITN
jgi:hypothetical protein